MMQCVTVTVCCYLPKTTDVIVEDLSTLFLLLQIIWQQLELHDHVGQPGGDLLLEEEVGAQLVGGLAVVQQMLDGDGRGNVPRTM